MFNVEKFTAALFCFYCRFVDVHFHRIKSDCGLYNKKKTGLNKVFNLKRSVKVEDKSQYPHPYSQIDQHGHYSTSEESN